jgi:hypothetical protein
VRMKSARSLTGIFGRRMVSYPKFLYLT